MAWNKDKPASSTSLRSSNPEILANWDTLETALNREHEFSTGGTVADQAHHKKGSARCYFQDAAPGTRIDGTAFTSEDLGSLWFDTNSTPDNQFNVLTATTPTWTPVSTEIIATLLVAARVFGSTLGVTGNFAVNTNKFTIAAATGNTVVAGTFTSAGVATLSDSSQMATSAAPTADADLANKKYIDDTYLSGQTVQVVNTQVNAKTTGITVIPFDDTIPQITEGDEYMTLAITPTSATNKLKIEVTIYLSHTAASHNLTAALFQDATANALASGWVRSDSAQTPQTVHLRWYMTAGTTSETTFRVRAGGTTGATMTFNGINNVRRYEGTLASSITITEIKV